MTLLPNEKLRELLTRLTPIVFKKGVPYRHTPAENLASYSYTWCEAEGDPLPRLKEVASMTTFHTYGHPSLFKPSIAEVLSQLDPVFTTQTLYFNTTPAYDEQFTSDEELHRGRTTFYIEDNAPTH